MVGRGQRDAQGQGSTAQQYPSRAILVKTVFVALLRARARTPSFTYFCFMDNTSVAPSCSWRHPYRARGKGSKTYPTTGNTKILAKNKQSAPYIGKIMKATSTRYAFVLTEQDGRPDHDRQERADVITVASQLSVARGEDGHHQQECAQDFTSEGVRRLLRQRSHMNKWSGKRRRAARWDARDG